MQKEPGEEYFLVVENRGLYAIPLSFTFLLRPLYQDNTPLSEDKSSFFLRAFIYPHGAPNFWDTIQMGG